MSTNNKNWMELLRKKVSPLLIIIVLIWLCIRSLLCCFKRRMNMEGEERHLKGRGLLFLDKRYLLACCDVLN
jgi:hypothetical protein